MSKPNDRFPRVTVDSASPTTRLHVGVRARMRPSRHVVGVGVLTALMAAGYSVFSLVLNYTFQTSSYDLVIFDEAVRSYAHFEPGISIIKGVHNGFGPHFSVLGDHWSPILAALAPLYWIYNGPQTLLVAQAVLFALAIPPLWLFTRRAFGGGRKATVAAYLVSVAYALSWPIASAAGLRLPRGRVRSRADRGGARAPAGGPAADGADRAGGPAPGQGGHGPVRRRDRGLPRRGAPEGGAQAATGGSRPRRRRRSGHLGWRPTC